MFDLTGKTALVSGAGQGVGAEIARALAALCVYLASDEASWMTGQTLQLNGGSVTT